jgi:Ca2+-binding RTX toxin-like protein
MEVGDDGAINATAHDVPDVRAFDLGAHADAAGAEDAPVVVEGKALVRCIDGELGVAIGESHVSEALLLGEGLKLAVAVRDADRADVVALGEEQFENVAAILLQTFGIGEDIHALEDGGDAGREQLVGAGDLDQADAARADIAEAIEMTEGGDVDVVLASDFEDGLTAAATYFMAVDGKSFDVDGVVHATTSMCAG